MGSVYWDPRGKSACWTIRFTGADGQVHRERTDARTKTLARRLLHEREREVEGEVNARHLGIPSPVPPTPPAPAVTFAAYAQTHERHFTVRCAKGTTRRYKGMLRNYLIAAFGPMPLRDVTPGHVEQYTDKRLASGATPATVRQELMLLSALYREARKAELVERNPVSLVDKPRVDNVIVRYLDPEEETRLLAFAPEPLRSAVIVAIHSGLREGEQCRLPWGDVRFGERAIVVRQTKAKRDRVVPMSDTLCRTLQSIPRRLDSPFVFASPRTGSRYDRFNNTLWRAVLERAGIQDFRWHDLRHTFGSRLAQAGVPLLAIKELLGHASITVTMRYAHLSPSNLRDAVGTLDVVPDAGIPSKSTQNSTHGVISTVFNPERTLYTGTR